MNSPLDTYWSIQEVGRNTLWFIGALLLFYGVVIAVNYDDWSGDYSRWLYELTFVALFLWFLFGLQSNKGIDRDHFLGTDLATPQLRKWWFWLFVFLINSICLGVITLRIMVDQFPGYIEEILNTDEIEWTAIEYLSIGTAVFFAPFVEECIFRGVLFQNMTKKWGFTVGAMASSALFAILHPITIIDAFFFGLAMCILFYKTNRLYLVILFHILYNTFALVLGNIDTGGDPDVSYELLADYWWIFGLVSFLTLSAIIVLLNKNWVTENKHDIPYER